MTTAPGEMVSVASEVLGPLPVPRNELITFPQGMFGFPQCSTFALLPTGREGTFWLQSADFSALAFLLIDPFLYFPGYYHIDLSSADIARLGTSRPQEILVLSVVTMPAQQGGKCTANLQAPVVFNIAKRAAFQSIRSDEGFGIRESFDLDAFEKERSA